MNRRALVIGAETGGLTGVSNDVAEMTEVLTRRGFAVDRREGKNAVRDGILDGYEKLISDSAEGDVAVVFGCGHGGYAQVTGTDEPPPELQFFVPYDYSSTTQDDFRGITALELSVLQARLTAETRNVTTILDTCHSAHMSRDPDFLPRAMFHPTYYDIAEHNAKLVSDGLRVGLRHVVGNTHAVRVVACAKWQSAYEYTNNQRVRRGLLTESLCLALEEAGDLRVTWATLLRRVRDRVERYAPTQRPGVEGPSRRLLFDIETTDPLSSLPAIGTGDHRVSLRGARLTGVVVGDEFALTPTPASREVLGDAKVDRVSGLSADAHVVFRSGHNGVPLGAAAHPTKVAALSRPILVAGTGAEADAVRAALAVEPTVQVVSAVDETDLPLVAEVEFGSDGLSLRDAVGSLTAPVPAGTGGTEKIRDDSARLARAAALRELAPADDEALEEGFSVSWGRVAEGELLSLARSGGLVHAGDHVSFRLRNDGDRRLYFYVFGVGVDGSVTLVTATDQSGLRLDPGREYMVGQDEHRGLLGVCAGWPAGLPAGVPRPEAVVVLVSTTDEDLSMFEQGGVADAVSRQRIEGLSRSGSPLQRMFAQVVTGGSRVLQTETRRRTFRFATHRIEYLLSPQARPAGEVTRFVLDERSAESVLRLRAPGARTELEVRFDEVVALRDGAFRVDVLASSEDRHEVRTLRLTRGTVLRDVILWRGPVDDHLDVACWLSPDHPADLGTLASGGSPTVDGVTDVLTSAAGATTPFYRTTFLLGEDLAAAALPLSTKDLSFALRAIPIG